MKKISFQLLFVIIVVIFTFSCDKKVVDSVVQPQKNDILVDKDATQKTVNLFNSLQYYSTQGIMVGQQDPFTGRHSTEGGDEMSDMKLTCGKHPLVVGLDFLFVTNVNNTPGSWYAEQEELLISQAKMAYRKGLVVTYTWHFNNPYTRDWFYVESDPERIEIAKKSMKSLVPGGENNAYYKSVLAKIASVMKQIKGDDGEIVPCFFRPFHEFEGSWFWWGAAYCTPEEFKAVYQFTVEYMRDELDLHNVLYAYSPDKNLTTEAQYLERYPGDDYVDLIGMDNYGDFVSNNISAAAEKLKMVSDYALAHNKLAALTECGFGDEPKPTYLYTRTFLAALKMYDLQLAYMMFWSNSADTYYVPTPNKNTSKDFISFANDEYTLLEGDVSDLYGTRE